MEAYSIKQRIAVVVGDIVVLLVVFGVTLGGIWLTNLFALPLVVASIVYVLFGLIGLKAVVHLVQLHLTEHQ